MCFAITITCMQMRTNEILSTLSFWCGFRLQNNSFRKTNQKGKKKQKKLSKQLKNPSYNPEYEEHYGIYNRHRCARLAIQVKVCVREQINSISCDFLPITTWIRFIYQYQMIRKRLGGVGGGRRTKTSSFQFSIDEYIRKDKMISVRAHYNALT